MNLTKEVKNNLKKLISKALDQQSFRKHLIDDLPAALNKAGLSFPEEIIQELELIQKRSLLRSPSTEELMLEIFKNPKLEKMFELSPAEALSTYNIFVSDTAIEQLQKLLKTEKILLMKKKYRESNNIQCNALEQGSC